MKKALVPILGVLFVALLIGSVAARDVANPGKRAMQDFTPMDSELDPGMRSMYESSALDTYNIVWYNFEQMNWQGWTREDNTAQKAIFWHVDDFAGLGGGKANRLWPISGAKSMWCGARPAPTDPYLCGWKFAPGYGNGWNQVLGTAAFAFQGPITFSYKIVYDSEPGYDYTDVQYDAGGYNWQLVTPDASYTGVDTTQVSCVLNLTTARTKLRFHMYSDGAWSDEDGLWNTDGASIIDDLAIANSVYNNTQDFEAVAVGATTAGAWIGAKGEEFGKYSGLKNNLNDKDPCGDNFATQVVFFIGSPNPSTPYPGLFDTPFCMGSVGAWAPCQDEQIVSPIIDMTKYDADRNGSQESTIPPADLPLLGGTALKFTVYRDIPLPNLVFYVWSTRKWDPVTGCPSGWADDNYVYYGPDQDYIFVNQNVGKYIATNWNVQVSVGCVDMCDVWYLVNGNCGAHTPSPWIDNVRVERYKTAGPQWGLRQLDVFNDNFPEFEYQIESYVRADAANDLNANDNPVIRPGDSIVVDCSATLAATISNPGGIGVDATGAHVGGARVYMHVRASYVGPSPIKPQLYGPQLAGDFGWYDSDDGSTWTIMQMDTARTAAGIVENKWGVDLNDALFTRGYRIDYYFKAYDLNGTASTLPRWAGSSGPYYEFTCLPTLNSDVLLVDDCTDRHGSFVGGAEDIWTQVFKAVLPLNNQPDIYDVMGPSSGVSNGPGSRAKNAQLTNTYYKIIWDSGQLESVTISDGTVNSDKSNDCQMLIDWMSTSEHVCGLWVCGDDVAYDLDVTCGSAAALTLLNNWCGVDFVATSYFDVTGGRTGGGVVTPLLTGHTDANIFVHAGVPDKFYAWGGCPVIDQLDCLEKTNNGKYAASYPSYLGNPYYGAIASTNTNSGGHAVNTMWFGFTYINVRDDVASAPIDRFELARDVIVWMQNEVKPSITGTDVPKANGLAQNFPNPFNPSTTIKYDMKDKGLVTVKVYNVAGQLVRTLVNGVKDAGSYSLTWDGMNDRGGAVASGIYFYKMETKGFSETKKMVMLR